MDNEEVKDIKQEFGSHEKMNTFAKGVNENYTGSAPDNADVVFGLRDIWNKIAGKGAKKDDNDKKEEKREIKPVEVDVINTFDENGNPIVLTKAEFEEKMSKDEVSMVGCDALWSNEIKRSVILNKMQGGLSEEERKKCEEDIKKLKEDDYKIKREDWKEECPKRFAHCVIVECKTLTDAIDNEKDEAKRAELEAKRAMLHNEIGAWVKRSAENLAIYREVYDDFEKKMKEQDLSVKLSVQKDVKSADFEGLNMEKDEKIKKILDYKKEQQKNNAPKMEIVVKNEDKLQAGGERKYYADMKILAKEEDVNKKEVDNKPSMKILDKVEDDRKAEVKEKEITMKKKEVKLDKKVMYEKIKQRA